MMPPALRRRAFATVAAATLVAGLAACASDEPGADVPEGGDASPVDTADALEKGGEITVWAWEPALEKVAKDFEEEHPNVTVQLEDVGSSDDEYAELQQAIAAGEGVPDVAQVESYAVSQLAGTDALTDLGPIGASDLEGIFTTGPWDAVHSDDGVYGLPMDSSPMALFYNQDVFDKHGIEVPATWDEFLEAARAIHEADPQAYITNDVGDPGFVTSMIWQATGKPFQAEGSKVTLDLATDPGVAQFTKVWQQLLDEELLAPVGAHSDEWYQGLADGTIAALPAGASMAAELEAGLPEGEGKWRVAGLPQWDEAASASAENGGSALTVPAASQDAQLAYAFVEYATMGEGVQTRIDDGAFPATAVDLVSSEFLATESEYFGGQKINEVLAASSSDVVEGWQYLPFQVDANSAFHDTAGPAYEGASSLKDGLVSWQQKIADQGAKRGYTVHE